MKQGDLRFGTFGIIAVTVIRLILFPWIARIIFSTIHAKTWFASNPLLGLFVLQQTNLTSASSIQLMVNMIQKQAPFVRVLKKDVAYIILLQFCIAPVFLTLNTALSIALQLS